MKVTIVFGIDPVFKNIPSSQVYEDIVVGELQRIFIDCVHQIMSHRFDDKAEIGIPDIHGNTIGSIKIRG